MALAISDIWDPQEEDRAILRILTPLHQDAAKAGYQGAANLGPAANFDLYSDRLAGVADTMASRVTGINQTTRDALNDTLVEGLDRRYTPRQIADGVPADNYPGVTGVFADARGYRAAMIVRTESSLSFNLASLTAYRDAGMNEVEVVDGDHDAACADANGSHWSVDEAEANPISHPNCRRYFVNVAPVSASQAQLDGEGE